MGTSPNIQIKRKILNELFITYKEVKNSLNSWQNSIGRKKEIASVSQSITIETQESILPFFTVEDYDKHSDCKKFINSLQSILDIPSQQFDYENLKMRLRADTDNGGCGLAEDDSFLQILKTLIEKINTLGD